MKLAIPLIALLVILVVVILFDRPVRDADLNVHYISIETLDPQRQRAAVDIRVSYALFEGLCTFEPTTFTIEPGVASSWEVDEAGVVYTFHLRDDARWSNGDPVTAEDFLYAWHLGLLPDTGVPYVMFLTYFAGADAYAKWANESLEAVGALREAGDLTGARQLAAERWATAYERFLEMVAVKAIDDHTLQVRLREPTPFFLEVVACWPTFPLHRPTMERFTQVDPETLQIRRDPEWVKPANIISNGPYVLSSWRFKRELLFVVNEHYWNQASIGPQSVRMVNFTSDLAAFNAYITGAIDLFVGAETLDYAAEMLNEVDAGIRNDAHAVNAYGTYYFSFNCRERLPDGRPNPFADPRVRQAFTLAIDRDRLVRHVTRLDQQPAYSFIPPDSIAGYELQTGPSFDLEKAKRLLAEAGYPGGRGFPRVELVYNTGGGHERRCEALAAMWRDHLNVDFALDAQEWKIYLGRRNSGDFMISRAGWFGDYGDPTTFLDLFRSDNGNNDSGYQDPAFDAIMDAAADAEDSATRTRLLQQAEAHLLNTGMPLLPLYYYRLLHLYNPDRLENVSHHPRNMHMYHRIRIKSEQ